MRARLTLGGRRRGDRPPARRAGGPRRRTKTKEGGRPNRLGRRVPRAASLGKEPSGESCASNDGCHAQNARRLRPQ